MEDDAATTTTAAAAAAAEATTGRHDDDVVVVGRRPSMTTLRRMLRDRRWDDVMEAIRRDATVSMRIDDSDEEDRRFRDARRDDSRPRYWVGNGRPAGDVDDGDDDAPGRVHADVLQRRTLLHSLCRMDFPLRDDADASSADRSLRDLEGAVRTATMLIEASHNRTRPDDVVSDDRVFDGDGADDDDENAGGDDDGDDLPTSSAIRRDGDRAARRPRRQYCPPALLPPVERRHGENDHGDRPPGEDDGETTTMVRHTSVLTMTDAMGGTPLHALTEAGSCHVDLVRAFVKACRRSGRIRIRCRRRCPPSDGSHDDEYRAEERRPTVYDLLAARNYHGCTPMHFLAGAGGSHFERFVFFFFSF
jgi:hypothetical protein